MPQISEGDESMNIEDFLQQPGGALSNASGLEAAAEGTGQFANGGRLAGAVDIASQISDQATDAATSNPALTAVLVVVALAFVAGTIWGLIKGAIKMAITLGIIAAVLWFFVLGR